MVYGEQGLYGLSCNPFPLNKEVITGSEGGDIP